MYKVEFLGTEGYEGKENGWYGDGIVVYNENSKQMMAYDCGSEQHADRIIDIMKTKGFTKTDIILSHNDKDHFEGIPRLIESGKVGKIFTTLLLRSEHLDEILDRLDNKKRTREATKKRILKLYDNIAELTGNDLKDVYLDEIELPEGITFIGPSKDVMLDAVVKAIENDDLTVQEGDETLVNATSLQFAIKIEDGKDLLLLADASFDNIICDLTEYNYIQLPHHGKLVTAEQIFYEIGVDNLLDHEFIVSDNTGSSNGGSDELMSAKKWKGKVIIKNTIDGDIKLERIINMTFAQAREKNRGI